jgi:PadR family transcriptional regulator, regulatory protein AphA
MIFEPTAEEATHMSPSDIVASCYERDAVAVLLDDGAFPADFFDISSRVAGELTQKLMQYGIRLAAVVPNPEAYSDAFRSFLSEANRSRHIRFAPSREKALAWLHRIS